MKPALRGTLLHDSFLVSVVLKLALGIGQLIAAAAVFATSPGQLVTIVAHLTAGELQDDPSSPVAHWLLSAAHSFSIDTQSFYAIYFLGHGCLNAVIAAALLARQQWSYPVSMWVLGGFVVYQLYRFAHVGSAMMLVLSAFDLLIILLVWQEYKTLKRQP